MAAKGKLTPDLIDRAVELVALGNYDCAVYAALGISKDCWYRWLREGEGARSGLKHDFYDAVMRARPEAELAAVEAWQNAFSEDWRAAKDFLARRFPERWREKKQIDLGGLPDDQVIRILESDSGEGGEAEGAEGPD